MGVLFCSATHTHDEESNVENKWLLEYSKLLDGGGTPKPLSLALSEFHFILLINNILKVFCSCHGFTLDNIKRYSTNLKHSLEK